MSRQLSSGVFSPSQYLFDSSSVRASEPGLIQTTVCQVFAVSGSQGCRIFAILFEASPSPNRRFDRAHTFGLSSRRRPFALVLGASLRSPFSLLNSPCLLLPVRLMKHRLAPLQPPRLIFVCVFLLPLPHIAVGGGPTVLHTCWRYIPSRPAVVLSICAPRADHIVRRDSLEGQTASANNRNWLGRR